MKRNVYFKPILYAFLMILLGVISYLLIFSGFNTKTKLRVNYEEDSNILYKVYLLDNDVYDSSYLTMNQNYAAKLVDYIDVDFMYENIFSEYASGYYKYYVNAKVVAYEEFPEESLWEKEYSLLDENVVVLDKTNINSINILDNFVINYNEYRNEILDFEEKYNIDISGYLLVSININEMFSFNKLDNEYPNERTINIKIPLSDENFHLDVLNNINNVDSHYEFSSTVPMNFLLLTVGILFSSGTLASCIMVFRELYLIAKRQSKYEKKLKGILSNYGDRIIKVKKFYNMKKYNMIYVDSIEELMDVYQKLRVPISYKELIRGTESIFLIVDNDNAWIYRMISKDVYEKAKKEL